MSQKESNTVVRELPSAHVRPKSRFSLIWIIPLTALLIGSWLLYKYYSERGTIIDITFDQASGIEERKTTIRYKDVVVGKVKTMDLSDDLDKVKVTVEIFPSMAKNLGSSTRFWIVKPRISLQGVSGLDTLLSGVHIGIDPGTKGEPLEMYTGLPIAPYVTNKKEGTRITLRANSLGSLEVGSPIYHNKINVGEVTSYRLSPTTNNIDIFVYIHEPYDQKVKSNTRFWNASGIEVELTAAGVSARMESITSLILGGIAFETPKDGISEEINGERAFTLFKSYKIAKDNTQKNNKLFFDMYFQDSLHGLKDGAAIEFSGVKVGKVESIKLVQVEDNKRLIARVSVSLNIDKFSPKENAKEAEQLLHDLVSDGLVAQLTVDSLITGAQFISLNIPANAEHYADSGQGKFQFAARDDGSIPSFPTTVAKTGLLNFDATRISQELNKTLASVSELVSSNDIKKILSGLATTTSSIGRISEQLDKEGFSGELLATLNNARQATQDISKLLLDSRSAIGKIGNATDQFQKDASLSMRTFSNVANILQKDSSQSMKTFNNVANKLQKDVAVTLGSISQTSNTMDSSLKATMGEDSGLQYRLQLLINDLSEASKSFSVLADTIQRKPNSVIFGK